MNKYGFLIFHTLAVISILVLAYWTSLHGPFVFDDFNVFVKNDNFQVKQLDLLSIKQALTSSTTGLWTRPIALFTLLLNYHVGALNPFGYKLVNLVIHLMNGVLLYLVLLRLLQLMQPKKYKENDFPLQKTAFFIAAIWLLHPLNLTSVLYVVQRMASLAATFMSLALLSYLNMRYQQITQYRQSWWYLVLIALFIVAGLLTKENSIIVVGIMFCIETILLKQQALLTSVQTLLKMFTRIGWLVVLGLLVLLLLKWHWLQDTYAIRSFTLEERLLTQSRVLWLYLKLILVPNISEMTMFHDDIVASKSLLEPITTLWAIVTGIITICVAFVVRKKSPLVWLGLCWYLVAHLVESSVIALELVHEHRNYFPMIGVWLAMTGIVTLLLKKFTAMKKLSWLLYVFLGLLATGTWIRAQNWHDGPTLIQTEVLRNPQSSRNQFEAGRWFFAVLLTHPQPTLESNGYKQAKYHFEKSYQVDSNNIGALLTLIRLNEQVGLPPENEWVKELENRLSSVKIDSDNMKRLVEYVECGKNQICHENFEILNKIVLALDENKQFIPLYKSFFYFQLGVYFLEKKLPEYALFYFSKAEMADPDNQNYDIKLAAVLYGLQRVDEAKQMFNTVDRTQLAKESAQLYDDLKKLLDLKP